MRRARRLRVSRHLREISPSRCEALRLRLDLHGTPAPLGAAELKFSVRALVGVETPGAPELVTQEDDYYFNHHQNWPLCRCIGWSWHRVRATTWILYPACWSPNWTQRAAPIGGCTKACTDWTLPGAYELVRNWI
jgi:hypothetical protein